MAHPGAIAHSRAHPCQSHSALAESSRTPASVAWRTRIRGSSMNARGLSCLVSSSLAVWCVGGIFCYEQRDGSDGWQSPGPRGDTTGGARSSTSPANHHFCVPPTGLVLRDGGVPWTVFEMACFQRGELLRQPLPFFTSLRRRYFLSFRHSSPRAGFLCLV